MDEYYCDEAKFIQLIGKAEAAKESMEDALSKAKTLQGEISGGTWSGEQKKTMDAFMDLLVQYHSDLVGEDPKPMNSVIETMQQMINNSEDFYSNADIYKDLEGI